MTQRVEEVVREENEVTSVPMREDLVIDEMMPKRKILATRNRSDLEISAAILRITSHNGGIMITSLRERANLSWNSLKRYVHSLLLSGLLVQEIMEQRGDLHYAKIYKPTEQGLEFLRAYTELVTLANCNDKALEEEEAQCAALWSA